MIRIHMRASSMKDGIMASFHNICYTLPLHIHQYSELVYVLGGEFTVITEGKREVAKKGDIVIIPPYQPHAYYTEPDCTVRLWMFLFSNSLITDMIGRTNSYSMYEKTIFSPTESLKIFIEDRMFSTNEAPVLLDEAGMRKVKGILYPIFDEYLSEVAFKKEQKKGDCDAITLTLQYLSQHYLENITLSDVCIAIGYSKSHISHLLTEKLSLNFRALLNSFRISYARNLLINENMKIFNIAIESGFETERTFHRVFKEIMEMTPKEYKSTTK